MGVQESTATGLEGKQTPITMQRELSREFLTTKVKKLSNFIKIVKMCGSVAPVMTVLPFCLLVKALESSQSGVAHHLSVKEF